MRIVEEVRIGCNCVNSLEKTVYPDAANVYPNPIQILECIPTRMQLSLLSLVRTLLHEYCNADSTLFDRLMTRSLGR